MCERFRMVFFIKCLLSQIDFGHFLVTGCLFESFFFCEFGMRAGFEQTIIHIVRCVIVMQKRRTHNHKYTEEGSVDFLSLHISKALHSGHRFTTNFNKSRMFRSGDMHLAVVTYRLTMLHSCLPRDWRNSKVHLVSRSFQSIRLRRKIPTWFQQWNESAQLGTGFSCTLLPFHECATVINIQKGVKIEHLYTKNQFSYINVCEEMYYWYCSLELLYVLYLIFDLYFSLDCLFFTLYL